MSAHIFSMIEIMNAALMSEGFEEIITTSDGSDECRLLSRNWPLIVEREMEDSLYSFARRQVFVNARQTGRFGYPYAYPTPAEALHVRNVWVEGEDGTRTKIEWVQDGEAVHVAEPDGIYIEYAEAADPSFWGPNFAAAVQMRLQAVLLRVRDDRSAAAAMDQQAEMAFQRARTISSKARSAKDPYVQSRYARARFNRG